MSELIQKQESRDHSLESLNKRVCACPNGIDHITRRGSGRRQQQAAAVDRAWWPIDKVG